MWRSHARLAPRRESSRHAPRLVSPGAVPPIPGDPCHAQHSASLAGARRLLTGLRDTRSYRRMPKKDVVAGASCRPAARRDDALRARRSSSAGAALVFLSGVTAAPVYHSHPHREEEFDLPPDHARAGRARHGEPRRRRSRPPAGCALADLVSATRYLTDVREQDDLNRVWALVPGAITCRRRPRWRCRGWPHIRTARSRSAPSPSSDAAPPRARRARATIAVTPSRKRAPARARKACHAARGDTRIRRAGSDGKHGGEAVARRRAHGSRLEPDA